MQFTNVQQDVSPSSPYFCDLQPVASVLIMAETAWRYGHSQVCN